ncbi:MAG: ATP-binding cassette domain-containing protein [Candidatus Nanopelagicales bacterium]|nr:ATP-binding cassette domain-containing protein [Candidatus Nanopelagicales bacterium]
MTASPTTTSRALPSGTALRIHHGEVLIFAAPSTDENLGRWVPVTQVTGPTTILGCDLPTAVLLASPQASAAYDVITVTSAIEGIDLAHEATAALAEADEEFARKSAADQLESDHDTWLIRDALTDLAAAVPGYAEAGAADDSSADVIAMRRLSGFIGLPVDPLRLRAAVADAHVSGRDRITALAAACDATVRRQQLPPSWWKSQGPPLLLTVLATGAHVVAHWRRGGYAIWDPKTDRDVRIDASADDTLSPTGMLLQPLLDPSRPAQMRDLVRMGLRGAGSSAAMLLSVTAVMALLSAAIPVVSGRLTTEVANSARASLLAVGIALVLIVAATVPLAAVRGYAIRRIRTRAVSTAAAAVFDRQLRLPMHWHKGKRQNERIVDATAVDTAANNATDGVIFVILDTVTVFGALLGAYLMNPWLAVTILVILAVRSIVDIALVRRLSHVSAQAVDADAQSPVLELLRGYSRLRASGAERRAYAQWAHFWAAVVRVKVRLGRINIAQQVSAALWPALSLAIMLGVIAVTMEGRSQAEVLGVLVTGQVALTAANSAVSQSTSMIGVLLASAAMLRRAESILSAVPESAGGGEIAPLRGGVDLHDVTYRYEPELPPIFTGLSLSIQPGEHVALVGPSGAGKTTLLRLILGLDEPETGQVSFDGKGLPRLDRAALRRQIGVVMQSSALLPGSIRDNVDLGRGLTATQVWEVLDRAAVGDDVRAMPMGINTVVVEGGSGISGGQRQRILLARALAGNPRIIILDEATSALDNVSQAAVTANLDTMAVTRIVVAHRLSTIRRADRIAVLDGGRIVQEGSFAALVSAPGPFRTLVERQSVDALEPTS